MFSDFYVLKFFISEFIILKLNRDMEKASIDLNAVLIIVLTPKNKVL